MDKQRLLDQIKAEIIERNVCPDLAKTATQLVFGDGDPESDIVFIGEAPGKNEDEQGVPFVGAAGKFLDVMLDSIHLKREQIYITNIVKYRPPNNRDPLPDEKKAFLPYLLRQIRTINPKLVITLGRHSGEAFLPDLKISRDHGSPKKIKLRWGGLKPHDGAAGLGEAETRNEAYREYDERESQASTTSSASKLDGKPSLARDDIELIVTVLPLYHPAAALYNGGQRQVLIDDFSLIPVILDKIRKTN